MINTQVIWCGISHKAEQIMSNSVSDALGMGLNIHFGPFVSLGDITPLHLNNDQKLLFSLNF